VLVLESAEECAPSVEEVPCCSGCLATGAFPCSDDALDDPDGMAPLLNCGDWLVFGGSVWEASGAVLSELEVGGGS